MRARPAGLVAAVLLLVLVVAGVLAVAYGGQIGGQRRVAMRRADLLQHGVNLSGWFAQGPADPAHLQTAISADDLQRIRRMGFDHVRLPVDPQLVAPSGRFDAPDPDVLYYLEDAVRLILDNGLSVLVDLHPPAGWGQRLATDPAAVDQVAVLWGVLARRLGRYDPDRVLFEVLNEPSVGDPSAWMAIQQRLAASIRSAAPKHTIIATGPAWSAIEHLEQIQPLQDANVIYAFHLYEPFSFTHQGASWGDQPAVQALHDVPYPFDPAALAALLPTISDQKARELLTVYAGERWDAARIEALVARAAAWRDRSGAPIICTEFGVYRPVSPPAARIAWLRDARAALERHRIGWTTWEYAGGFGVVDGPPGRRVIHAPTARALFEE